MLRRTMLLAFATLSALRSPACAQGESALALPRDFGSHDESRIEWWYVTGSVRTASGLCGFQVTFFRSRTDVGRETSSAASTAANAAPHLPSAAPTGAGSAPPRSRFAPDQLLFAHAALTDLGTKRLRHDQRIARRGFGIAESATGETRVVLRDWQLTRSALPGDAARSLYRTQVASETAGFAFELSFEAPEAPLLQGEAGLSRKGPGAGDTSRYYSEPQLAVRGTLTRAGRAEPVTGRAWLDHEWSDAFIPAGAIGWDWIGMNLDDGSALTAFRLRRADGGSLYAGGSFRPVHGRVFAFPPDRVVFTPGRVWESGASRARYPVEWRIDTPAGAFRVRALLDDQELDSRASTGSVYWEGLSELQDAQGGHFGTGYLEMTGYAAALRL